jgi:hypothetical protein
MVLFVDLELALTIRAVVRLQSRAKLAAQNDARRAARDRKIACLFEKVPATQDPSSLPSTCLRGFLQMFACIEIVRVDGERMGIRINRSIVITLLLVD